MVRVQLYRDGKPLSQLILFADLYEYSVQDAENEIFGSYWFDHKAKTSEERMAGKARSRIDILQAPWTEGKPATLVYRYWNGKEACVCRALAHGWQRSSCVRNATWPSSSWSSMS